jgi:hypothetical protein
MTSRIALAGISQRPVGDLLTSSRPDRHQLATVLESTPARIAAWPVFSGSPLSRRNFARSSALAGSLAT